MLRQALPMLRRGRFLLQGRFDEEIGAKDVTWMSPSGGEMQQAEWDDAGARCFGVLLDGRAQAEASSASGPTRRCFSSSTRTTTS